MRRNLKPVPYKAVGTVLFVFLMALLGTGQALAKSKVLSIELAFDHIDVTSGFSGAQIEVFGHRRDKYTDVAIVVTGPEKNITVWRKARILGAWINRYAVRFRKMPLYYGYAVGDGEVFNDKQLMKSSGIGLDSLIAGKAELKNPSINATNHEQALISSMQAEHVYPVEPLKINYINDYFFRTHFLLPANAPTGTYKIRSFLFKEGKLSETDIDTSKVEQVGLNAFIYGAAHKHEALYGIFCVVLALISGWFVGILRIRP